jgi:AraC family transcriptional regulator, arabinose operon regulatory protein
VKQRGRPFEAVETMASRIANAPRRIEERMGEPLTVADIAREFNLSPSRFAHLFREEFGVSPMRYLQNQRMVRARLLLERTFLTVKEVMVQVGCSDPSHFARDFRRFHGLPPKEWRATRSDVSRDPKEEPPPRTRGP